MVYEIALNELDSFAQEFWKQVHKARVFAFYGQMGAGKTTLISALCHQKGVQGAVSSPTFSIINEYVFEEEGVEKTIYHIDLYRLNNQQEIVQTGVEDCLTSGAICLVEWPEKAPEFFDEQTVRVTIQPLDNNRRSIAVEIPSAVHSK